VQHGRDQRSGREQWFTRDRGCRTLLRRIDSGVGKIDTISLILLVTKNLVTGKGGMVVPAATIWLLASGGSAARQLMLQGSRR
jgi:hypothetical protein